MAFYYNTFFLVVIILLSKLSIATSVAVDTHTGCADWAAAGECENNPGYMLVSCATSCAKAMKEQQAAADAVAAIGSVYDLQAHDIDGNLLQFSQFKGMVVILTNVASYCGYTKSHYEGLVQLWAELVSEVPGQVEILAFPCNQFGQQEPGSATEIKMFAKDKGVSFRMMEKINVNGPNAHIVYKYLKHKADGPHTITWNFATYFVIAPNGQVDSYSGIEPMELQQVALSLLNDEL